MFKVAILGCENSHANAFLRAVIEEKVVDDIEFVGVYSDDPAAAQKLHDMFGVPVAERYDEFVGKVDGLLITARHGDNHFKYAKPYIESGIPMFIDKPITCSEADAQEFMDLLKRHNIRVSGGSVLPTAPEMKELKSLIQSGAHGKALGGFLRAPVDLESIYGGFHFYCQHLVQMMTDLFGNYPKSVQAFSKGDMVNCVVRYDEQDVNLSFVNHNYVYYAGVSFEKAVVGYSGLKGSFSEEFMSFYNLLLGKPQTQSYEDFFAPVYIHNAILRSMESGKEEPVHACK